MLAEDLPREALQAMRANRLRSFLTLLGIIIGVATLVGVVSVISGLNGWVQEKVITLSPDVYVVTKFGIIRSREEFLDALKRRDIDYDDYRRLSSLLRKADEVAADVNTTSAVKHRDAPPRRRADPRHHRELRRAHEPRPGGRPLLRAGRGRGRRRRSRSSAGTSRTSCSRTRTRSDARC